MTRVPRRLAKNIVVARIDIPAAAALVQFANAGLKRFHLTVRDVPFPAGAPDISTIRGRRPQGWHRWHRVTEPDQDAVNFVDAVRQAHPTVKIALDASSLGDVNRALEKTAEGITEISITTKFENAFTGKPCPTPR